MKQTFKISGMTCNGCTEIVYNRLSKVPDVKNVLISLADEQAEIEMVQPVPIEVLQTALEDTIYNIYTSKNTSNSQTAEAELLEHNKTLATNYITAVANKDYNTIEECLHENFKFYGMINYNSAMEFIKMLKDHAANPATDIVLKNEINAIFVNSNEVYVIYNIVAKNNHSVPCIEWLKIDNGKITSTELKIQQYGMQLLIQSLRKEKPQLQ